MHDCKFAEIMPKISRAAFTGRWVKTTNPGPSELCGSLTTGYSPGLSSLKMRELGSSYNTIADYPGTCAFP
jgi:hypothetical protein